MSYSSVKTYVPGAIVALINGAIVACCTLASIWMTTSPVRWIMPKIGGLSWFSVPQPRGTFQSMASSFPAFFCTASGCPYTQIPNYPCDFVPQPSQKPAGGFPRGVSSTRPSPDGIE
jgi:hypothetical protein